MLKTATQRRKPPTVSPASPATCKQIRGGGGGGWEGKPKGGNQGACGGTSPGCFFSPHIHFLFGFLSLQWYAICCCVSLCGG